MFIAVTLFVFACIVLLFFWRVKQNFPKKYQRRCELQANFAEFAQENRAMQVDQKRIDVFWTSTNDTWNYFYNSDIHHLRQSLQDNAYLLISINQELAIGPPESQRYTELNDKKNQILEWFGSAVELMDPMFKEEILQNPSFSDIWRQCLRVAGRLLRA